MNVYRFQYETATGVDGESETLDPVTIEALSRAHAAHGFVMSLAVCGGRPVRCGSCSKEPLLVGETVCPECAPRAKLTAAQVRVLAYVIDVQFNSSDGWTRFYAAERRVAWRLVDAGLLVAKTVGAHRLDYWKVTEAGRAAHKGAQ